MLRPQIIVFERETRFAPLLGDLVAAERWVLREPRQREPCWEHLRQLVASVFLIHVQRPADAELEMLQQVAATCPQVAIVAVGSVEDADTLAMLCWDMGADYALFPPLSRDLLPEVVRSLMHRAIQKQSPLVATGGLVRES
jgi:DNA-binding NarL/FixJ family response regulator